MLQAILEKIVLIQNSINKLETKLDEVEKRLTERIDRIGSTVAYLEDDAPTIRQFNKLEKRVTKLEKHVASN